MSKAIFSLFCVAALFNSGLVSGNVLSLDKVKLTEYCTKWTEGAGDAVGNLGTFLGDLSKKGIGELEALTGPGADDGSVGDQVLGFLGDGFKALLGAAGKFGDDQVSKVCAKVGLKKEANPNSGQANSGNGGQANSGNSGQANSGNGGQANSGNSGQTNSGNGGQANSGNGQVNRAGLPGSQTETGNGGNTVQIPTIFFLILAIFNQ